MLFIVILSYIQNLIKILYFWVKNIYRFPPISKETKNHNKNY